LGQREIGRRKGAWEGDMHWMLWTIGIWTVASILLGFGLGRAIALASGDHADISVVTADRGRASIIRVAPLLQRAHRQERTARGWSPLPMFST
jgi:hypothetical protein